MLEAIGVDELDALFEPIPEDSRRGAPLDLPAALSEPELMGHLAELSARSAHASELVCFAGGGAYDHHVPAAVAALAARSEFATSYTPYQAELSQGVLQALFEFQSLICELYGMEVANASLYDGANSLTEGVNLAVRVTGRERVLVGGTVHPHYAAVLQPYTPGLGLAIERVPVGESGAVEWDSVDADGAAAVVVASPNFMGLVEDVAAAAELARAAGALSICVADPTAMGLLAPPGDQGVDVAGGGGVGRGEGVENWGAA